MKRHGGMQALRKTDSRSTPRESAKPVAIPLIPWYQIIR